MFKSKEELKNYLFDNWNKSNFIKLSLNKNIKNIIEKVKLNLDYYIATNWYV